MLRRKIGRLDRRGQSLRAPGTSVPATDAGANEALSIRRSVSYLTPISETPSALSPCDRNGNGGSFGTDQATYVVGELQRLIAYIHGLALGHAPAAGVRSEMIH